MRNIYASVDDDGPFFLFYNVHGGDGSRAGTREELIDPVDGKIGPFDCAGESNEHFCQMRFDSWRTLVLSRGRKSRFDADPTTPILQYAPVTEEVSVRTWMSVTEMRFTGAYASQLTQYPAGGLGESVAQLSCGDGVCSVSFDGLQVSGPEPRSPYYQHRVHGVAGRPDGDLVDALAALPPARMRFRKNRRFGCRRTVPTNPPSDGDHESSEW